MLKHLILHVTTLLLTTSTIFATEIHEIYTISELTKWTDSADTNTLIVFDMDYTIAMPENPVFHRPNFMKYVSWIRELEATLTPDEKAIYPGVFMSNGPLCLVEKEIPLLIKALQERLLKVIVLTGSPVGKIGDLPSIENWRVQELSRMGIDISQSFPDQHSLIFSSLAAERGYYPVFKHGILSTNGDLNTKGETLMVFLDSLQWKPSKVIFIDDKISYIRSMEPVLPALGIEYIGIHYRGSERAPSTELSEDTIQRSWQEIVRKTKLLTETN